MKQGKEIKCSFCGRDKSATNVLIAGMSGHICDQCITQAQQIVNEEKTEQLNTSFASNLNLVKPVEIKKFFPC